MTLNSLPGMNRILPFLTIVSVALSGAACSRSVSAVPGVFETTTVNVSSEIDGKILGFYVSEGDAIVAGQELALIDTLSFDVQINTLLAEKNAAEKVKTDVAVQTKALNEQLARLESDRDRIGRLVEAGAASRRQLDQIETNIAVVRSQIDAASASIRTANETASGNVVSIETQIRGLREMKDKCHIRSSADGVVIGKYAQAGEITAVGRPLLKIADMDNVFLKAYFKSSQLQNIRLGQEIKVIANFGKDAIREYEGIVTWISQESQFSPKTIPTDEERSNLVYPVKIAVRNDGYIKLGFEGEAVLPDE